MVKVVFLHPDLGIGGAERAVIDAALALKSRDHDVEFVTAHHNPDHCFKETSDGSVKVTVAGDWLPRSIFGRLSRCKILFYCHFPDMLLTQRESLLKRIYRAPIDWLEEKTTGMADCVLVNSKFTSGVFHDTFTSLGGVQPQVLYPIPDFSGFDIPTDPETEDIIKGTRAKTIFLSINRYERKKNLNLAIDAFSKVCSMVDNPDDVHLIMAGGYDDRVTENKDHFQELCQLAMQTDVRERVTFLRSISDKAKHTLLSNATCLLYTPDREHFGIVPIEAMYSKLPVIAVNSGGPMETVSDKETGFLCEASAEAFAEAMMKFARDPELAHKFGEAGKTRVKSQFSFDAFTLKLNRIVSSTCGA